MILTNKIKNIDLNDLVILFILIFSFKVLFFFTGYILEDSFIVFRSAFNYADYGIFSYNLDEQNTVVTSKIFGLICSFLRIIFKEYAILSIIVFNSILSFFSSLIIILSLKKLFENQNKILFKNDNFFLVTLIFLNPSISLIGITGLEFSILIFFISLVLFGVIKDSKKLLIFSFFIPLIRIELIGFILILSFIYLYFLNWKNFTLILIAGIIGSLINGYLNIIFDGSFIPSAAVSKWSTLGNLNTFTLERILNDFHTWFFGSRSFFIGIYSKYISEIFYTFVGILVLIYIFYNFRFLILNKYKEINDNNKIYILVISASVLFLPLAYVVSGRIFDWYLYPYSFLSYILLSIFLINNKYYLKLKNAFISFVLLITIFQFLVLKNIGFQENSYRSVIGKDIFEISLDHKKDTLFLEPSRYIPFYAKIKTYDTVGLSSQEILNFRSNQEKRWWLDFIESKSPTFVLDRNNIFEGHSYDGKYDLNLTELSWFKKNYKMIKNYNYHQYVKRYAGSLESFYLLGNHSDYYLYKKIID